MRAKAPLYPRPALVTGIALGCGAFFCAAGFVAACGSTTVAQCRLEAAAALPVEAIEDPDLLTFGDVHALAQRLHRCNAQDAGAR